jgi:hypothetical protein
MNDIEKIQIQMNSEESSKFFDKENVVKQVIIGGKNPPSETTQTVKESNEKLTFKILTETL